MSEEELVEAYTSGRIGRRVFVRRLVAAGIPLSVALAYARSPAAWGAPTINELPMVHGVGSPAPVHPPR